MYLTYSYVICPQNLWGRLWGQSLRKVDYPPPISQSLTLSPPTVIYVRRATLDNIERGHNLDRKKSFCIVKRFEPGKIYILTALRSASSPTTTPLDTPPKRAGKS